MFEVTSEKDGARTVIIARGEIDLEVSSRLWSVLEKALVGAGRLHVRLTDVTYIDSSGIATLVKGLRHAQKSKAEFALVAPSEQVRAVIQLAQLDRLFTILGEG
jgi:anti-sigma B factor antagonist